MLVDLAKAGDIPDLCILLNQLFTLEVEFSPDLVAQRQGLQMIIGNPDTGAILIARQGRQLIGMVSLLYSISTALGARVALLEDMLVAADQRNSGVGSQLMKKAIAFAKDNGCQRLTLLTDSENLDAQRFYQRQGFRMSSMVPMRMPLPVN